VQAMLFTRMKVVVALLLFLGLAATGVGLAAGRIPAAAGPLARAAEPSAKEAPKAAPKDTVDAADLLKQATEAAHSIDNQTHKVWALFSVAAAKVKGQVETAAANTFPYTLQTAQPSCSYDVGHA